MVWFDIKFLKLNCLWEVYAGFIVNFLECIFLYKVIHINSKYKTLLIIPILLFALNLNRFEILTTQFYFRFAIRIFLYVMTFYLIDKYVLITKKPTVKISLYIAGLLAFEILFLSQLYFPALLASIVCVFMLHLTIFREKSKLSKMLYIILGGGLGVILYFYNNSSNSNNGGNFITVINSIKNGKIFIALCYMLVAQFFQQPFLEELSYPIIILFGTVLFALICLSIFLFFKKQFYKETWLPLFLILYGSFQVLFIIYGRISYGLFYLTASRYTFETALLWIGCSYIFVKEICITEKTVE